MSLRGAFFATKQSPCHWETASLHSQRHTSYWCDALEAQLKSAEEVQGQLMESGFTKIGGLYGE